MSRIAFGVEYDGRDFHGWESQVGARTVQQCLERALSRVADHPVRTVCAGRTDAGVHGLAQVVHCDADAVRPMHGWVMGANTHLPPDACVLWARPVAEAFHARFSARSRVYRYVILNRATRPAAARGRVAWVRRHLDVERMQRAADFLLGTHDFSAYRASACQARSPVRTVHRLEVSRHGRLVCVEIEANAFLHHMVRNVVGVLTAAGAGDREPGWAGAVLEGRDRTLGGVTAEAGGLYLASVRYPESHRLPDVPSQWPLW